MSIYKKSTTILPRGKKKKPMLRLEKLLDLEGRKEGVRRVEYGNLDP